jgi:IS5 family transposase
MDHAQSKELEVISNIIDANPIICNRVLQDLNMGKNIAHRKGANGMSAEQVLRSAIVKTLYNFSYKDLAFHLVDSQSLSWFCRIGIADKGFKKSALNKNIKAISATTWQMINTDLLGFAKQEKIEKGRKVRVDCTCVESNIHHPTDSSLLWDAVRVLTRLMERCRDAGVKIPGFHNHIRVAKRRMLAILNAKRNKQRKAPYADLLKTTGKVVGYAKKTIEVIKASPRAGIGVVAMSWQIGHYVQLAEKVINQTERRVIRGEKVDASDKVVSIFEPHTDIIVKDRRDTYYGHKICLTGGASNLILDCLVLEGNPADTDLSTLMLDRQKQLYGRYPLKASFDGGFASKDNLKEAKSRHIKDVCFAKKRGLKETEMCRSHYVYLSLRRFRAGIESGISWLKRCLGLTRCTWKGWDSFKSYVWSSIVAANLLTIARAKP